MGLCVYTIPDEIYVEKYKHADVVNAHVEFTYLCSNTIIVL